MAPTFCLKTDAFYRFTILRAGKHWHCADKNDWTQGDVFRCNGVPAGYFYCCWKLTRRAKLFHTFAAAFVLLGLFLFGELVMRKIIFAAPETFPFSLTFRRTAVGLAWIVVVRDEPLSAVYATFFLIWVRVMFWGFRWRIKWISGFFTWNPE